MLRSSLDSSQTLFGGGAHAEHPLEHEPWIGFRWQRIRRAPPRHRIHVRAGVAVVACADDVVAVDRDFQRRQLRVAADLLGDHLIDRRAGPHVCAFGLLRVRAGHERWCRAWMLPTDVPLIGRLVVVQPCRDHHPIAERLDRLQGRRHLEVEAFGGRRPVEHVAPVPAVNRRESGCAFRLRSQRRQHRVEERQRHCRTHAADERPPWQR